MQSETNDPKTTRSRSLRQTVRTLESSRLTPMFLAFAVILIAAYFAISMLGAGNSLLGSLITVGLPGGVGGLLYSMRERKLVVPHRIPDDPNSIDPGFLVDIWFGLAGAYVVFLIVPGDFNFAPTWKLTGPPPPTGSVSLPAGTKEFWEFIKVTALAIVGGYGGRAMIDRALADVARKVDQMAESQQKVGERLKATEDQVELDAKALELVSRQLDSGPTATPIPLTELLDAIKKSTPAMRQQIFHRARRVRMEHWEKDDDKAQMERTIPVFEALVQADEKEEFHRPRGQLGYALKDKKQPEYERAAEFLTKAIDVRNRRGEDGFLMYEFCRAICRIEADPAFRAKKPSTADVQEKVRSDLEKAKLDPYVARHIKSHTAIQQWSKLNKGKV